MEKYNVVASTITKDFTINIPRPNVWEVEQPHHRVVVKSKDKKFISAHFVIGSSSRTLMADEVELTQAVIQFLKDNKLINS